MLKRMMSLAVALMLLLAQTVHALPTGKLFNVSANGPTGTVEVTLCLNGIGVLSCQKYTVNNLHLIISTVYRFHNYPYIGILINTPGYTFARLGVDCTPNSSGYCIFGASSVSPAFVNLKSSSAPNVQITATPSPVTFVGDTYTQTNVASSGVAPYVYSVAGGALPPGTTLDPTTGTVSGVPTSGGPFSYTIEVTDTNFTTATATTTGTMLGGVILTSTPSAIHEVNIAYSQTNVASGGSLPYTYSISAGAVPTGTALDPTTGTVSGTPTVTGPFSYTVLVTDGNAGTASSPISGTIASPVGITATPSPNSKVGLNYAQANNANNGTTPYVYSVVAGALPTGTSLNTSTGVVSGTPTTVQPYSYSIGVTDGVGGTASAPTSGTIAYNPWTVSNIDSTNNLTSVSCPNSSFCMTLDTAGNALEYNGSSWLSSPIPAGQQYVSVSCPTTSFCAAVGNSGSNGSVFIFNGTTWTPYVSNPITSGINLVSVSCTSATFCVTVDGQGHTFIFDGTTWNASTALGISALQVSCSSPTFCMVTGMIGASSFYDGTSWHALTTISTASVNAVSCTTNSSNWCTAVDAGGSAYIFSGGSWNGGVTIDGTNNLKGVSCLGTAFCNAVDALGNGVTFNGNTWSAVSDIDAVNVINSVSCPSTTFCAAVDNTGNAIIYNPRAADVTVANQLTTPAALTFPVTATGNVAPTYNMTHASGPFGVFIDSNNNLWVADTTSATVTRFKGSDTGNATPSVSIANSSSTAPSGVVTDAAGNIYVVDAAANSVFIYPATFQEPGTYAAATPSKTIVGGNTGLSAPHAIALDSSNNIWVVNQNTNSIVKFAAGTTGGTTNQTPAATVSGAGTGLSAPNGIFIDAANNVWVTNSTGNNVTVYAPGATGAAAPTCTISSTSFTTPVGIAVDTQGLVYQANDTASGAINIFAAISPTCGTNTATPTATITGATTLLDAVGGLALGYVF